MISSWRCRKMTIIFFYLASLIRTETYDKSRNGRNGLRKNRMIASTMAKGKENGKRADNESTTTTIISLSQQMAHKHSRRVRRKGRRRIWQATRVNQPNRSMIYKKEEVTSWKNESSCSSWSFRNITLRKLKCLLQFYHLIKQVEIIIPIFSIRFNYILLSLQYR